MNVEVVRLGPDLRDEFYRVHCAENGCDWCFCVAWWVPTWEGWGDRTAEQNRALRDDLFERGEYDGYLARIDGQPVGWCQVGPRDRLAKLVRHMSLPVSPETYAVTCFQVAPALRRRGVATALLAGALADLRARGVRRVEAYPRRRGGLDPDDMWTGPEDLYARFGFRSMGNDSNAPVVVLDLLSEPT